MRLIFPSATISITVFASRAKPAVAVVRTIDDEKDHAVSKSQANGNRDTNNSNNNNHGGVGGGVRTVASLSSVGNDDECNYQPSDGRKSDNHFKTTTIQSRKKSETGVDVGVLAAGSGSGSGSGCRYPIRQTCVPDNTSSLGGRCRNILAINNNKLTQQHDHQTTTTTTPRFLQNEEEEEDPFVCLATCPTELCTCANTTEYGFPDPYDCATELNTVCTTPDGVDDCFPSDELPFYQEVYCEFSSCWLKDGSTYEDCACGYYQNYCGLYGEYATAEYPKVVAKCLVSDCCDGARSDGEKVACIPALMPSSVPSVGPTESLVPSGAFVLPTTLTPTGAPSVVTPEDNTPVPTTTSVMGEPTTLTPTRAPAVVTPEDNTPVPPTTSVMGESFPPTRTPKTMTSMPSSKPSKTKPQVTTTTSPPTDSEMEEAPTIVSNDTLPEEGATTPAPPPSNNENGGIHLRTSVSSMMVLVFASVGWGGYLIFA